MESISIGNGDQMIESTRAAYQQAVAAGAAVGGRPVVPFMRTACFLGKMPCYDQSRNNSLFLSPEGVSAGLTVPYEVGAAGVVIDGWTLGL